MTTADRIVKQCDAIRDLLVEKNRAYGDSATDPVRIFSKADALEQLNVRLDDKLSRVMRGTEYPGDDTILDIVGYLVLLLVAREGEPQETLYRDRDGDLWVNKGTETLWRRDADGEDWTQDYWTLEFVRRTYPPLTLETS